MLARADLYVHTAAWEAGVPLAPLEAACFGLPVIVRSIPELEDSGFRTVDTSDKMAAQVSALQDPASLAAEALTALAITQRYSRENQRSQLLAAYASVCGAAASIAMSRETQHALGRQRSHVSATA